jgi:uncharacterized protein YndB with AHSA1/START domain
MSDGVFLEVRATIAAPLDQVWDKWTQAGHVVNWNFAHESWCCPRAQVDFCVGGTSSYRMEAKDGSMGFDLNATFTAIEDHKQILSVLADGRKVAVDFSIEDEQTVVIQCFEPEQENPLELQQGGWQAILNQFKSYCE